MILKKDIIFLIVKSIDNGYSLPLKEFKDIMNTLTKINDDEYIKQPLLTIKLINKYT